MENKTIFSVAGNLISIAVIVLLITWIICSWQENNRVNEDNRRLNQLLTETAAGADATYRELTEYQQSAEGILEREREFAERERKLTEREAALNRADRARADQIGEILSGLQDMESEDAGDYEAIRTATEGIRQIAETYLD